MASQMMMFQTESLDNGDGSFTVRPRKVRIVKELKAKRAAAILGVHVQTIYRLCELGHEHGGLRAYKLPSARGNASWRIDWEFLMGYKERRQELR